jgi:hypothetical protein
MNIPLIIKSKADVESFFTFLKKNKTYRYADPTLSWGDRGVTVITMYKDHATIYSYEVNWRDQHPTVKSFDEIKAYIWRHRKDINAQTRKDIKYSHSEEWEYNHAMGYE